MKRKPIIISLSLIALLLILVMTREIKSEYIKLTVEEIHLQSVENDVFISSQNITEGQTLIILDNSEILPELSSLKNTIHIIPSDMLERKNRRFLDEVNGNIVLYSNDLEISTNVWVSLTSLGYRNIQILTDLENAE